MALFFRNSRNVLSLINNFYIKFSSFAATSENNRHKDRIDYYIRQLKKKKKEGTREHIETDVPFDKYVVDKRRQASRSILIAIKNSKSIMALYNNCSLIGNIVSMDHYHISDDHYVLVEFENESSVNLLMEQASIQKNVTLYVKTSFIKYINKNNSAVTKHSENKVNMSLQMTVSDIKLAQDLSKCTTISQQADVLYKTLKLTDFDIKLRFHTAWQIEQVLTSVFPNVVVHPFGSSVNGFGKKSCDLDLVLNFLQKELSNPNFIFLSKVSNVGEKRYTAEQMNGLANFLTDFVPGVDNVKRILQARVPIIKFRHTYSNIDCDLSMSNMIALYMTELLYLYGQIDHRVRPLVFTIRTWARIKNVTNENPGRWITNFSLSLLVIFYLQQKSILPTLNELKYYTPFGEDQQINGYDHNFIRKLQVLKSQLFAKNTDSIENLLYNFFEYYSRFNFNAAISLREGKLVSKCDASALYICNPLEPTLNVTKNVTIYELERIKSSMKEAANILASTDKSTSASWGLLALLNFDTSKKDIEHLKLKI